MHIPARDHGWTQGEVMPELLASSIPQYAVIKACRTEGPSVSFVIAYPDEESLRDLIAGPSIIACGFATRQEAQAKIDADFWTAPVCKRTSRLTRSWTASSGSSTTKSSGAPVSKST